MKSADVKISMYNGLNKENNPKKDPKLKVGNHVIMIIYIKI